MLGNKSIENAARVGNKLAKINKEPSAVQANVTYLIITVFMSLSVLLGKALYPIFTQTAAIVFAVLFFVGLIVTFIFAEVKKGKRSSLFFYYTTYLFSVLAITFCMLAVNLFYGIYADIKTSLIISAVFIGFSLIIFAIYSIGKFEKLFSLFLCTAFIAVLIIGAMRWANTGLDIGIAVVFISLGFLLLQSAFSLYIFSNTSFFSIMAGFTVVLVGIGLVIALMVIGGGGDCDCGGCDCGVGTVKGTRRNKSKPL